MEKEVTFIYNQNHTKIQCKKSDTMKDICRKFSSKISKNLDDMTLLYYGGTIDNELNFEQQAKPDDNQSGEMKVLVLSNEEDEGTKYILSKDIICPICGELCFMNIKDYKITLYECKNGHKMDNCLSKNFIITQKIDISKIICDKCKEVNKATSYENTFYSCLTCKQNLCPLCKSEHDKEHSLINYDQKNYNCPNHNDKYTSYCNKCKINLCIDCEAEHKDKENIINYKDIIPPSESVRDTLKELKLCIDTFRNKINNLIKILKQIDENVEAYYNINNNLIKTYEKKNRNFQVITNVNNILNNNNSFIKEINEINKLNNNIELFANIVELYEKINDKNDKNVEFNEIITKYEINKNDKKVQIFGYDFVKNNKYNFEMYKNGIKCDLLRDSFPIYEKDPDILEIRIKEIKKCTNMKGMFMGCSSLISISKESKWNTKNIIDMSFMFSGCSKLKELPDISQWNTNNVKDISYMFCGCELLTSIPDISKWNIDNVCNLQGLFSNCKSLSSLPDISIWNTNNVDDMSYLFYECELLKSLPDISKWNTNKLTDLSSVFSNCSALVSLPDISIWNTNNVNDMSQLFGKCKSIISLPDISKWNTENVQSMKNMFAFCSSLKSLPDIAKWNTKNVNDMTAMFYNCPSLESLPDISGWNINNVKEMKNMFYGKNEKLNVPSKFVD